MDELTQALTRILQDMRLSGGVFLDAELTAPWCIRSQVEAEDCRPLMVLPPQLIAYHYVVEGRFLLEVEGAEPVQAAAGLLLVLPRNTPHRLASAPGLRAVEVGRLIETAPDCPMGRLRHGGGGAVTRLLCGYLGSDQEHAPLLASLPPVITLTLEAGQGGRWVEASIRHAREQLAAGGPAASASLARLAELLFAEAVREYVARLPEDSRGWLAGLQDPVVARALALLHGEPTRRWTLEELARCTAASRSVLNEHFTRHLGMPPMQYLRRRRLALAADRLRHSARPIAAIALEAGYDSEAAFCRSFKRTYGASPGAYRAAGAPAPATDSPPVVQG